MLSNILQQVLGFLALTWWFWVFVIMLPLFRSLWLFYKQEQYKRSLPYTFFELLIPRETRKSPRAMAQVLAAIHSLRNAPSDIGEEYLEGEVTEWHALEMVSFGGEVHFYIRTPTKRKALVEAQLAAYYPDVEVVEVEDYIDRIPATVDEVYAQGYDLWATEMLLTKPGAYPIKTYLDFEAMTDEKEVDPICTFLEILGGIKREEIVGIQILIAPLGTEWKDKYDDLVEDLKKLKEGPPIQGGRQPAPMVMGPPEEVGATSVSPFGRMIPRSPGETDILKAVENNLSKLAFNTIIRFIYLSPRAIFQEGFARKGLVGAFDQFTALDLNRLWQNVRMSTRTRIWHWPHLFPKRRGEYRKHRMLYSYRRREMPPQTFMGRVMTSHFFNWNFVSYPYPLSTDAIATIFHPPTYLVLTAPHIKRVESRKGSPPAGLPIYGEEGDIKPFQ